MVGVMFNPVTLTRGIPSSDLPEDWDEAYRVLMEKSHNNQGEDFSPQFVVLVCAWGESVFGEDARNMTVTEIAEYWYEFA